MTKNERFILIAVYALQIRLWLCACAHIGNNENLVHKRKLSHNSNIRSKLKVFDKTRMEDKQLNKHT